jgi:hypothetical protein
VSKRGQAPAPESVPPLTGMPPTAAETAVPPVPEIYFVIMDRGGIFGVYFDAMLALNVAQSIEGVVVTVPIAADFRKR